MSVKLAPALRWIGAVVAALGLLAGGAAAGRERVVNVYNWSDYIDPTVIEAFTKETGIAVRYDTFDSNDTLESKLLMQKSGFDVVVPSGYFLERQIKANVFLPLDKAKLPNLVHAWDEIAERQAAYDPGNRFAVNYMWGTTGIGYNVAKAKEILGPDAKMDSWDILFKPEIIAKFKDCGVHMLDSADDVLAAALHYLKLDPNTTQEADLNKAAELMMTIRPFVRKFHSSEFLNALATGEICLAFGYSGDVKQAQKATKAAGSAVEIGYAIPKGGAQMWFDNLAIPRDAPNPNEAHALIDFLLRPDVAAKNSNMVAYANGNNSSQVLLDKVVLEDRSIYPDAETRKSLYVLRARDQRTQRVMNRIWTRIKTGR